MKKCVALFVAALLVGAASAVVVTWDNGGAAITSGTSQTVWESGTTPASFTVAALVTTAGALPNNSGMVTFGGDTGGSPTGLLSYGTNGLGAHFAGSNSGGQAWSPNAADTASGQYMVALVFAWNGTQSRWDVSFWIDGTNRGFQGSSAWLSQPSSGDLAAEFKIDSGWTLDGVAIYDAALTAGQIQTLSTTKDFHSVPEPTALALLALGVAGLALRRRVA